MSAKDTERALIDAVNACVHYQEHIDTGESFDLLSAKQSMRGLSLSEWMRKNEVMLPSRRDGKSAREAVE